MRQVRSGRPGCYCVFFLLICLLAGGSLLTASKADAQTQQPYLFATTQVGSNSAVASFTRNTATGTLSEVSGSPFVLLTPGCYPATIEPKARYLLGSCGDGISLYQFNSATGVVSEVPTSPFAASTGGPPQAVIAEANGKYAYALRITRTTFPDPSPATLDSFVIDAANNVLSQPSSQTLTLPGTYLGLVVDPNDHFIDILYASSEVGTFPSGNVCTIFFDPQSGLPEDSASGICQPNVSAGTNPLGISIDSRGTLVGTAANGQNLPRFTVFAISPSDGSFQGSEIFTYADPTDHPSTPSFDPTGQIVYANSQLSGLRIFSVGVSGSSVSLTELPSSPLPSNIDGSPIFALPDPAADFTYMGSANIIQSYPIDSTTGYPGTPVVNTFQHSPSLNLQPVFVTMPPAGQAVSAPAVSISSQTLIFGPIHPGEASGPQTFTISSTGNEALTISSIAFSPSPGPFFETDSCLSSPVLAPGTSCQVSVSYYPTSVGVSQVSLVISDNAAGSPESVALSGTATAPPPPAPEVTLVPGTLNFPGTTTQGESSAAQPITVTNSGNAPLTYSSAPTLSGVNTADFSIASNTCTGSLAANSSCTVSVLFSPFAAGVRTTNLVFSDNASSSPQSVTLNGNALAAATFTPQSGTSDTVTAGQPATFALQATPGAGFTGTLAFSCTGSPTGAACTAPSVNVASGTSTSFTVTITTSGSAVLPPTSFPRPQPPFGEFRELAPTLLAVLLLLLDLRARKGRRHTLLSWRVAWLSASCFALFLLGCGGAGSPAPPQPQQIVTPSGTYAITITPTATPAGSTKTLSLNPIMLTLIVK